MSSSFGEFLVTVSAEFWFLSGPFFRQSMRVESILLSPGSIKVSGVPCDEVYSAIRERAVKFNHWIQKRKSTAKGKLSITSIRWQQEF